MEERGPEISHGQGENAPTGPAVVGGLPSQGHHWGAPRKWHLRAGAEFSEPDPAGVFREGLQPPLEGILPMI